MLEKTRVYL
ncbi:82bbb441-3613-4e61-b52a-43137773e821 [Thermothielavioides terrestris]|uniref:82bbb441-3613-4e61-b52a-43137773e821 n=1 Tax=Thermothielavioides terrestris TaxID=2587410 RepID=A0A446B5N2_9PEZI|nr:82bbb441-3613-4e61-b52a-43137773e821 [Thermothielavioides terrestris]